MLAPQLHHLQYEVENIRFHLHISGELYVPQEQLLKDFEAFTKVQLQLFDSAFSGSDYHFLIHLLPYKHYHGVEHLHSTVMTYGPAHELQERKHYLDFIGLASHELFHVWNVKTLRPAEMVPYRLAAENYFRTGWVAEGFTTYYGDLMLARSGAITLEEYEAELDKLLKRHFSNLGRKFASVTDSSADLWLDGYELGIPGRKTSIYVKGALATFLLDLLLRTKGSSVDALLVELYTSFSSSGYTQANVVATAEKLYGAPLSAFFAEVVEGTAPLESWLNKLLPNIGYTLEAVAAEHEYERLFGFRLVENKITEVAPEAPAAQLLSVGDELVAVNGLKFNGSLVPLADASSLQLHVFRQHQLVEVQVPAADSACFSYYQLQRQAQPTEAALQARQQWLWQSE